MDNRRKESDEVRDTQYIYTIYLSFSQQKLVAVFLGLLAVCGVQAEDVAENEARLIANYQTTTFIEMSTITTVGHYTCAVCKYFSSTSGFLSFFFSSEHFESRVNVHGGRP